MPFQKGNTHAIGTGRPPSSEFSAQMRLVVGEVQFKALAQSLLDWALSSKWVTGPTAFPYFHR